MLCIQDVQGRIFVQFKFKLKSFQTLSHTFTNIWTHHSVLIASKPFTNAFLGIQINFTIHSCNYNSCSHKVGMRLLNDLYLMITNKLIEQAVYECWGLPSLELSNAGSNIYLTIRKFFHRLSLNLSYLTDVIKLPVNTCGCVSFPIKCRTVEHVQGTLFKIDIFCFSHTANDFFKQLPQRFVRSKLNLCKVVSSR